MSLYDYIGMTTTLTVARQAAFGYFLTNGEEDALLHENDMKEKDELVEGQEVEVFLYLDAHDRIVATTTVPTVQVGEYGWAKVVETKPGVGVFCDIGLRKDMLLGRDDLPVHESVWPAIGDLLYITLRVNRNHRIYVKVATDPVIQELSIKATETDKNKNIQGHVYRTAKVGTWVYTAEGFRGFVHESERRVEPRLGEKVEGRIINVKEDGTVNISLVPRKQEALDEDAEQVYAYLMSRNGAMPYSDKSMPEDIKERFGLSKAAFKRALGKLMKEGLVYQDEFWTYKKEEQK